MAAGSRKARVIACVFVSRLALVAMIFFVAGAVGFFDDPTSDRIVYAVVAVVLLGVAEGVRRLGISWARSDTDPSLR